MDAKLKLAFYPSSLAPRALHMSTNFTVLWCWLYSDRNELRIGITCYQHAWGECSV